MDRKYKFGGLGLAAVVIIGLAFWYFRSFNVAVLSPAGSVGEQEKQLMVFALALSLIVVVPVFIMLFGFAWKYRASNPKSTKYSPAWDHNATLETIWWLVPAALITILSVVAWQSSHRLDPFRPLSSTAKPINIQVIALDWKWLFIYPEQHIATVNYVAFPEKTPVNFQITADAPMNSFWIPQLGGQIYAMPGMSTKLHLAADRTGIFRGSSANISGEGFAGMTFDAESYTASSFNKWVRATRQSSDQLTLNSYNQLAEPSQDNPPAYYALKEQNLYDIVVMKFMAPIRGLANTGVSPVPKAGQP